MKDKDVVYYADRHGTMVTRRHLRTRLKDEDLGAIRSVRICREPLYVAVGCAAGLALFTLQFGDLLYLFEQAVLVIAAVVLMTLGWSVASLKIGLYAFEKTVLWGRYSTLRKVREAIVNARDENAGSGGVLAFPVQDHDAG